MEADVVVRAASIDDLFALAELRWRWAMPHRGPKPDELGEFREALGSWMRRNSDDVVCLIAVKGTEFVGMAWLMMFGRVPNPDDLNRRSGDVQSVFVIPEHQGTGLGRQLMQALCEEADRRGVQKLTVNANDAAVGFYTRLGFASSTLFLQRDCQQSASAR